MSPPCLGNFRKAISRRESSVRFVGGKREERKQREEEGYNDLFCFRNKINFGENQIVKKSGGRKTCCCWMEFELECVSNSSLAAPNLFRLLLLPFQYIWALIGLLCLLIVFDFILYSVPILSIFL